MNDSRKNINLFICAIKIQNEATNRKKLKRQYVLYGWKIFQLLQFENHFQFIQPA